MSNPLSEPSALRFEFVDTRRWVINGCLIGALAYTVLAAFSITMWGWDPPRHQQTLIFSAAGCVLGAIVAGRKRSFLGGMIGLTTIWLDLHYSIYAAQSFPTPALLALPVLIVAAVVLLRPRQACLLAVVSTALVWPLVLASPPVRLTGIGSVVVFWLIVYSIVSLGIWGMVALGFSVVDRAFVEVLQKERALAETIDKAPDGILVIDARELVVVANPAARALLGAGEDALQGKPIADVLAAAIVPESTDEAPMALDTGERPRTWTLQRPDGARLALEVTWRTMDAGRKQLVLRDVSERMQADQARRDMELQLAHSQRLEAVGQLAGGIAHDFNNILTIVGASAEMLRDELPEESSSSLLDEIIAAQDRGVLLTRQLLAFARREVVNPVVFDVSNQVLTLRRLLQRVAGEQTRVTYNVEPDCRIRADVGQVEQALVNLVTNARDAMPAGGQCTISVVRMTNDDGKIWVRLRVTDEGVGMDEGTRARAFEPFFTTKPRGRGTGLGLASVHGMALQSGGRADIESAKGRGTHIILEFPFADAPSTVIPTVPAVAATGGTATILVAEDDDGTRAVVARILTRLGYRVVLAPDGTQALRLAETHRGSLNLLLTDVMMPGMSGPQLAARVRELMPQLPVIFMSGYPEDALEEVRDLALESDFLPKPFSSELLARRVADKVGLIAGRAEEG